MANNYTGCAFALDLPSAEAAEYAVMTAKVHNLRCKGDPEPNEYAEIGAHGDEPNAYELEPFLKDGIRLPETIITEIGTSRYSIYVDAEDCDFEAVAAWLLHLVKMYGEDSIRDAVHGGAVPGGLQAGGLSLKIKIKPRGRYGKLTILGDAPLDGTRQRMVWVACDCGRIIKVAFRNVRSGNTKSCGCGQHNKQGK